MQPELWLSCIEKRLGHDSDCMETENGVVDDNELSA